MLYFSGFELYSRWVPLNRLQITRSKSIKHQLDTTRTLIGCAMFNDLSKCTKYSELLFSFLSLSGTQLLENPSQILFPQWNFGS